MLKKQYLAGKSTCKVTFTLPIEAAPNAKEVHILGDFNDWDPQNNALMQRDETEYFYELELATGRRYEFRYLIDNEKWENDWQADDYVPAPFLNIFNSVLEVSEPLATAFPTEEIQEKAEAAAAKPKTKKAPAKKGGKGAEAVQDDLTKIEGIGPKIAGLLNERGVLTFQDLAKSNLELLKETLDAAGSRFRMHDPSTWAEQAQLAAAGDWDTLAKLQEELKGGKR